MADEAQDVQVGEISLEDFDGEKATPEAEPSTAAKEEAKEDAPAPSEAAEASKTDEDAVASDDEEVKSDSEPKPKGAEERKEQLNGEIRDLVSQRNNIRTQIEKMTGEVYQVATDKELIDEVNPETGEKFTPIEAKVEAMRQESAMSKYNAEVVDKQLILGQESMQVLQDFPIFNPGSDTFDKELAQEAAELLDANLIRDPNVPEIGPDGKPTGNGLIIGSNMSPYKLYKTLARASGISATKGQIQGQADAEKQLANVDTASSATPPAKTKDPLLALWEEDL